MYFFLKKNQFGSKISDLNRENEMLKVRLEELGILKDEKKELDIKHQSLEEKLSDLEKINVGLKKDLEMGNKKEVFFKVLIILDFVARYHTLPDYRLKATL